jgi:RNA polymerase sigma-70 factor (ECF subfamily)
LLSHATLHPDSVPLSELSDVALFQVVRAGHEQHFNFLYERYFSRIYTFIHVRVRNRADAEELTQESFAAVFRSADGYTGRSTPLAWIYGIAKNVVYNHLRRNRAHDARVERAGPDALHGSSPIWTYTPEDHLSLQRYLEVIGDRLGSVTPWQAEVFVLRHFENMPIGEIARRMDRSNDAIRSSLYRVKRMLVEAGDPDTEANPA